MKSQARTSLHYLPLLALTSNSKRHIACKPFFFFLRYRKAVTSSLSIHMNFFNYCVHGAIVFESLF